MKLSRSALLPFSASQMYQIVTNLEAYPTFLPGCEAVKVLERKDNQVVAKLASSYKKINIDFITCNTHRENESITMTLDKTVEQGPFNSLDGLWIFRALSNEACRIDFQIDFEMKVGVMKKLLNPIFEKLMNTQFDAFQKRAKQLHSKG